MSNNQKEYVMSIKQIHRFSVFQSSKILAIMVFIVMAIFFIPTGIFLLFTGEREGAWLLFLLAPFLYLVGCFIFYAVFFWFYNLVASKFGGIEIEFKEEI